MSSLLDTIINRNGGAPQLTVAAIAETWRALERQAPQPIGYVVTVPYREWKLERRIWRMLMLRAPLRVRRKK